MIKKKSYLMPLILIILSLLIIAVIPNFSMAWNPGEESGYEVDDKVVPVSPKQDSTSETLGDLDDYDPSKSTVDIGEDEIVKKANAIIGVIKTVGIILSVLILVILGIKFMIGSIEEKAEYKKTMIPYLIGAIMVFAIPQLVQLIYDITTGTLN